MMKKHGSGFEGGADFKRPILQATNRRSVASDSEPCNEGVLSRTYHGGSSVEPLLHIINKQGIVEFSVVSNSRDQNGKLCLPLLEPTYLAAATFSGPRSLNTLTFATPQTVSPNTYTRRRTSSRIATTCTASICDAHTHTLRDTKGSRCSPGFQAFY